MKIRFTGIVDIGPAPDDRGSVDIWVLNEIEAAIHTGPETYDVYDALVLSWEVEKED